MDYSKFHVVTIISNPIRYQSRYDLYGIFSEDIERKGAQLWTIEMQTGARLQKVTEKSNPRHIQTWASALPGELWHKENLINLAIQQLTIQCPDWRYVAWVDADCKFEPNAIHETAQRLQHFDVVQMWSHAIDLGPNQEQVGSTHTSYMYAHWHDIEIRGSQSYTKGGHPGFAWAARREAVNRLGGIPDFAILGSGDRHFCTAMVGRVHESVHGDMHPSYHRHLNIFQDRAEKNIRRNVGYVPGVIRHLWHGKKSNRGYASRWQILVRHQFNPDTDIKRDVSGLWQLVSETPRQLALRDDMRKYFRARNEDSIDVK